VTVRRLGSLALALALAVLVAVPALEAVSPAKEASAQPYLKLGLAHADSIPNLDGTEPIFILVLGDNYRKGIEESHLTDAIHIIGINPAKNTASIVGIPRDSYVEMPGQGKGKINEAYEYGGSDLAIATVEELTGIKMDYYMVAGFEGFKALVSELGGILVNVPYDIESSEAKINFKKGKQVMSGKEALEFTRARYGVPNGDFSRSENQGLFLVSMLAQMEKSYKKDPSTIFRWFASGMRNVETDVPYDQIIQLGFTATQIPASKVESQVTPGGIDTIDGASVVVLGSAANKMFKKMANDGII